MSFLMRIYTWPVLVTWRFNFSPLISDRPECLRKNLAWRFACWILCCFWFVLRQRSMCAAYAYISLTYYSLHLSHLILVNLKYSNGVTSEGERACFFPESVLVILDLGHDDMTKLFCHGDDPGQVTTEINLPSCSRKTTTVYCFPALELDHHDTNTLLSVHKIFRALLQTSNQFEGKKWERKWLKEPENWKSMLVSNLSMF